MPPVAHFGLENIEDLLPKNRIAAAFLIQAWCPRNREQDSLFIPVLIPCVARQIAREISPSTAAQSSARGLVDCARSLSRPPSGWPPAKEDASKLSG